MSENKGTYSENYRVYTAPDGTVTTSYNPEDYDITQHELDTITSALGVLKEEFSNRTGNYPNLILIHPDDMKVVHFTINNMVPDHVREEFMDYLSCRIIRSTDVIRGGYFMARK
jgi:hypothetical protein